MGNGVFNRSPPNDVSTGSGASTLPGGVEEIDAVGEVSRTVATGGMGGGGIGCNVFDRPSFVIESFVSLEADVWPRVT